MATTKKTPAKQAFQAKSTSVEKAVVEEKTAPSSKRAPVGVMKDIAPRSTQTATRSASGKRVWEYIKKIVLQDKINR